MSDDRRVNRIGAVGGKKIGMGNGSTRIKPAPVTLCAPQVPHDLTYKLPPSAEDSTTVFIFIVH
jgi:hypothetical protein